MSGRSGKKRVVRTSVFKSDFKKIVKSGKYNLIDYAKVLQYLEIGEPLPLKYKDHPLIGEWDGFRECHIRPDWLLIYCLDDDTVELTRMGSHSKLFG